MSDIVLLSAAERKARPWKNGCGFTREIAAFPVGSGLDDFDWRLSIADVEEDGPFSLFPGVDRHLAVLSGRLRLVRDGEADQVIGAGDAPIAFCGDRPAFAQLLVGPVRDLNLMVRRNTYLGRLHDLPPGTRKSVASTTIVLAPADTRVLVNEVTVLLTPLDALMLRPGQRVRGCVRLMVAEITRAP